jgi:hypothetical protein
MRSFLLSAVAGLAAAIGLTGVLAILVYVLIVAVWISALDFSIRVNRQEKVKPVGENANRPEPLGRTYPAKPGP